MQGPTRSGILWRILAALVGGALVLWSAGFAWFGFSMPRHVADPITRTDAIVVLTGGSQRLKEGLRLLEAGRARNLFVSGVASGVRLSDLMRVAGRKPGTPRCCITLGHDAGNTRGNAAETAAWARRRGAASLRLVTANYHMRRSLVEFSRAMPEVRIIPHPVFPRAVNADGWWRSLGALDVVAAEYNKYLAALTRVAVAGVLPL